VIASAAVRADEEKVALDKLRKAVVEAVRKRLPKAEMSGVSQEKEKGKLVYEVSLKKDGKSSDVTLTEDGALTAIEQEVAFEDLPKTMAKTFAEKYPCTKYPIISSSSGRSTRSPRSSC
jgi:hypothetical protein